MNAKAVLTALSTFALVGTSAAYADTVLTSPAVIDSKAVITLPATTVMTDLPLFGKHTWFDYGGLSSGYSYKGLLGTNVSYTGACGMNTLSAVIPNEVITAPVGQRRVNAMLDLRVFKFGFGFGNVNPRFDMRPAGTAF